MITIEDLTDVTLAIEDTYEDDEEDEEDLTDATLVSDDTNRRLNWCYSSIEEVTKVIKQWKLSSEESYQVRKVIKWGKLSSEESYQVMKVIKWKLSIEESYLVMKII